MSNYIKNILFSLLILMLPHMNITSKAMDDGDYEKSTVRIRKANFATEDQQEVQAFTKTLSHPQALNLEDSKVSWTSYLTSSIQNVAKNTYDILDYTTRNPQKAAIIGFCLFYQISAAAACECMCYNNQGVYVNKGFALNGATCNVKCSNAGLNFYSCH